MTLVTLLALAIGSLLAAPSVWAQSPETPRRGGVLLAAIGADAPSLDPHQEQTFATLQPVAPLYSTLLQIDPYGYPNVVGDVAAEWKVAPDGLTYTFKIRPGIRFHDGSPLTAADVKATYDKILFPPEGVRSIRKHHYSAITSVDAPDPSTVVFRLKFPSASLFTNLASPWNVIFPKKYLEKDPNYFKNNVMGSGPYRFKSYTRGSTFEGERNPDYFVKDRPYLDGYKFFISTETSVRAAAIRSGRAYIEFRDLPMAEVEAIKKHLGEKGVVQQTPFVIHFDIAMNNTVKPFTDVRVRKALTLAIDRYTGGRVLHELTGLRDVGALTRPGTEWAMTPAELERLPGFGRDAEKNRAEARRLLAEAGYPNGFKVVLKNRNVKLPYQDWAVYVIQEWRKIGVEAEHRPLETAAWYADGRDQGNFEVMVFPTGALRRRSRRLARAVHHRVLAELGALQQPRDRRPVRAAGSDPRPGRAPEAGHRAPEDRAGERVPHPRSLVVAQRRALGQGEKLDRAAESFHESEAPGRLARGGLTCDVIERSGAGWLSLSWSDP